MNGNLPAAYCPGTMLNGKTIRPGGAIRMAPPLIANRGRKSRAPGWNPLRDHRLARHRRDHEY
jgi:hypothetical protein